VLVSFPSLKQNTYEIQLQEEKIYFGSQFLKFQSMVTWPHYYGPVVKQSIIVERVCYGRAELYLIAAQKQKGRKTGRNHG
jgi:peptide methionine sulfoxide reductase MsrB